MENFVQSFGSLPERNRGLPTQFKTEALKLMSLYRSVNECVAESEPEHRKLEEVVLKSYQFCLDMKKSFEANNIDSIFDDYRLLSIKKLANFVEISERMTDASRRYRQLFSNIQLEQLSAYKAVSLPTSPGSPPLNCYVHAEIQMITFFAHNPQLNQKTPRVVGASKSACYLCSHFVHNHGQFFISRTHGKLYDQWTVPDTFGTDELIDQRRRYRRVLGAINGELRSTLQTTQNPARRRRIRRDLPNESDVTLPRGIPRSLLPSEAGTLGSHQSPASSMAVRTPRQSMLLIPEAARIAPFSREITSSDNLSPPKITTLGPDLNVHVAARSSSHSDSSPNSSPNSSSTKSLTPTPRPQTNSIVTPTYASRSHSPSPPAPSHSVRPPPSSTALGSPATIDSWDYSLSQTLTAGHSFRINGQNIYLEIEMEAGTTFTGKVQFTNVPSISSKATRNTIDIHTMVPDEPKVFRRSESEESLVINLQNGKTDWTMQMELRWE
ncbi:MAG: hypothetical protein LQ342_007678 [Letrouitia transgressa]|nr:MAG: hypothetical protein LQ342_007678 [Letrouitia transgressa]